MENMTSPMDQFTDSQLLDCIHASKDESAFNVLYKRHVDMAYRVAHDILRESSRTEDIVQKVFLKIFERSGQFKSENANGFRNWMIKIVINECYNAHKKGQTRIKYEKLAAEQMLNETPSSSSVDGTQELGSSVKKAVEELPENYRVPIRLHYYEGMNAKAISEVMLLPLETVRTRMKRGLSKLRNHLAASGVVGTPAMMTDFMGADAPMRCSELIADRMFLQIQSKIEMTSQALLSSGSAVKLGSSLFSKSVIFYLKATALLLFVTIVSGKIWWSDKTTSESDISSVEEGNLTGRENTHIFMDFNEENCLAPFTIINGGMVYKKSGGLDGSGGLRFDGKRGATALVVELQTPMKLPLHVSLMVKINMSALVTAYMNPSADRAMFSNFNNRRVKGWIKHEMYLTESFVFRKVGGYETSLVMGKPSLESKFTIVARGNPYILIDDLRIETVSSSEVPDVSIYTDAYNEIPLDKRKGKAFLDQLPRVDNKPAWLQFE